MSAVIDEEAILDFHLNNWARWMEREKLVRGYSNRACGCTSWGDGWDNDTTEARNEAAQAACVNALINDMKPAQRAAVHHCYLHAVFLFPRSNYIPLLVEAREVISKGLRSRGMW
jgi:hypothetical protein